MEGQGDVSTQWGARRRCDRLPLKEEACGRDERVPPGQTDGVLVLKSVARGGHRKHEDRNEWWLGRHEPCERERLHVEVPCFTKNCARYATYEGARRLALVSASCDENGVSDPSVDFRAVRAYHSGRARPTPLRWALPTVPPGWWRGRALRALVPNSPRLPSPRPNRP